MCCKFLLQVSSLSDLTASEPARTRRPGQVNNNTDSLCGATWPFSQGIHDVECGSGLIVILVDHIWEYGDTNIWDGDLMNRNIIRCMWYDQYDW